MLLAQVVFAIGLGMVLGVLNVFFRDVGQFFTILLQFWFWFTPDRVRVHGAAADASAAAGIGIRWRPWSAPTSRSWWHGRMPDWSSLLPVTVAGLLCCLLGMRLFRKRSGEMVDEL